MSESFYNLKIKKTVSETADATSYYFDVPADLRDRFAYKAGQYLTLKMDINGNSLRRCYSLCTSPIENEHAVTVKRVAGGKVSNYLNDIADTLTHLDVMPPEGKFILKPDSDKKRDHYFIAGGSGITPIMSMIKSVLEDEPKSVAHLFYANRNLESIIFHQELKSLQERYAGQLEVLHCVENPPMQKQGGLTGVFKKAKVNWDGYIGRIDTENLYGMLKDSPSRSADEVFYICGPGNMIDSISETLIMKGKDKSQIKREYFTASNDNPGKTGDAVVGEGALVTVLLQGRKIELHVNKEETILDALINKGEDPPYSCTSGACSTCVAKVTSGKVEMEVCHALDDDEIEEGYILTCQAHATSSKVALSFDE